MTNQKQIRAAFWAAYPHFPRRRYRNRSGQLVYPIDPRCAFVDYIDQLARDGVISNELAARATLEA